MARAGFETVTLPAWAVAQLRELQRTIAVRGTGIVPEMLMPPEAVDGRVTLGMALGVALLAAHATLKEKK